MIFNSIILATVLTVQLPMQGIIHEQPVKTAVIIQEKVVTKTVYMYVYVDKFGADHTNENREVAKKSAEQADQRPFQMNDNSGMAWEHPNREFLLRWVNDRNRQIDSQNHPSFRTILRQDVPAISFPLQNCGPSG